MNAKKVIALKNLPTTIPLQKLAVAWLVLDHFHANNYVMGGFYACAVVLLTMGIYLVIEQKETDIFEEK